MGPVRKDSSDAGTSKPYERKRKPVETDSDDDVQILEDLGRKGHFEGSSSRKRVREDKGKSEKKRKEGESSPSAEEADTSTNMVDYYKILEIQRTASAADIKKSYRKLALRWHPDKNPDNQQEANVRFRELSEAYEVLIDEKKRKIYDQCGKEGLINGGRPSPHRSARSDHHAGFGSFDTFGFGSPFGFGFPGFSFRDPDEVFKEFFRGDPMADLMDDIFANDPFFGGSRNRNNNRGQRTSAGTSQLANPFFSPFGPMGLSSFFGVHDPFGGHNNSGGVGNEFFSTTTFGMNATGTQAVPAVKRTSTSTRISNGKKIVTRKVVEGGVETITVTENGVLKTKTVNGVAQAIGY